MKWEEALDGVQRLFLDTAPAIYYFERHPVYFSRMDIFFHIRRERKIAIVTSPVTLAECLVHPIRRGLVDQEEGYRRLILGGSGVEFHDISREAAERAARLRASLSVSLMDALQIGVAVAARCQAFLTNDRRLSKISDIPIWVLEDFPN